MPDFPRWGNKLLWGYDMKQAATWNQHRNNWGLENKCGGLNWINYSWVENGILCCFQIFLRKNLRISNENSHLCARFLGPLWILIRFFQDAQLKEVFDTFVSNGANWFDTGDSYGTGELEGRAEELLGQFAKDDGTGWRWNGSVKNGQTHPILWTVFF